ILTYLLTTLPGTPTTSLLNHRNHSGNTPLHWAALNTHLACVKALVEAGADVSITNAAGLDAVFLAERADWKAAEIGTDSHEQEGEGQGEGEGEGEGEEEVEVSIGENEGENGGEGDKGTMSAGRQVVEWLLSSERGGELGAVGSSSGAGVGEKEGDEMDADR
ncbi:hypothetical protein BO71DRAFT_435208, partial [Aspergillus ellipticus CBS 707.79]